MALFDFNKENPDSQASEDGAAVQGKPEDNQTYAKVVAVINEVRPYIQADGGDVELVKLEDNIVYVRLQGACCGCPSSTYTLKMGIEARVIEAVPEIKSVEMI